MVRIIEIVKESPITCTITFRDGESAKAKPGQFLMVWIPGVDEIPMSVSTIEREDIISITVKNVGEATDRLCNMISGGIIGVRGPYGTSFSTIDGRALLVAGGTGLAPLLLLSQALAERKATVFLVMGAKTKSELVLLDKAKKILSKTQNQIIIATEDGSYGLKGLASESAELFLKKRSIDMIYTCGPEMMVKGIIALAQRMKLPLQASLERIMKCGVGICGSCCIGKLLVCHDGPVFSPLQLNEITDELGFLKRNHSGKVLNL